MYYYKEEGITMNQLINRIKLESGINKICFCDRLDPMACGIVSILKGEECKSDNKYNSNKVYKVKMVIGIKTDSDDVLGIIEEINQDIEDIELCIDVGKIKQKYHYYSSKHICARNKGDNKTYYHEVELYNYDIIKRDIIDRKSFIDHIISKIDLIDKDKDFRQEEIKLQWKDLIDKIKDIKYIELKLDVSSGFYVRQFIRDLSDKINIPLLAFQIERVKIYK